MAVSSFDKSFAFQQQAIQRSGGPSTLDRYGRTGGSATVNPDSPFWQKVLAAQSRTADLTHNRELTRRKRDPSWRPEDSDWKKPKVKDFSTRVDYYKVLGCDECASAADVRAHYRRLCLQYHPDKTSHLPEAQRQEFLEIFRQISDAYAILADGPTRRQYDRDRDAAQASAEIHGWAHKLVEHFKAGNIKLKPPGPVVDVLVPVRLEKMYHGGPKEVSRTIRLKSGKTTDVKFTLVVPRGCREGHEYLCVGAGDHSEDTQPASLRFIFRSKAHEVLELPTPSACSSAPPSSSPSSPASRGALRVRRQLPATHPLVQRRWFAAWTPLLHGRWALVFGENPFVRERAGAGLDEKEAELRLALQGEGMPFEEGPAGGVCGPLELSFRFPLDGCSDVAARCSDGGSAGGAGGAGGAGSGPSGSGMWKPLARRPRPMLFAAASLEQLSSGPSAGSLGGLLARPYSNEAELRDLRLSRGSALWGDKAAGPIFAVVLGCKRLPREACERLSEELLPLLSLLSFQLMGRSAAPLLGYRRLAQNGLWSAVELEEAEAERERRRPESTLALQESSAFLVCHRSFALPPFEDEAWWLACDGTACDPSASCTAQPGSVAVGGGGDPLAELLAELEDWCLGMPPEKVVALRGVLKRYPTLQGRLDLPDHAWEWSPSEIEVYLGSSGYITPSWQKDPIQRAMAGQARQDARALALERQAEERRERLELERQRRRDGGVTLSFRVVHKPHINVRLKASLRSRALRFLSFGDIFQVTASVEKTEAGEWRQVAPPGEGFVLVDGSAMRLGKLIEQIIIARHDPADCVPEQEQKCDRGSLQRKPSVVQEQQEEQQQQQPQQQQRNADDRQLRFRVLHAPHINVRSEPAMVSRVLRSVKAGRVLVATGTTKVVGNLEWFELQPSGSGWVLEHGKELGLGRLLERLARGEDSAEPRTPLLVGGGEEPERGLERARKSPSSGFEFRVVHTPQVNVRKEPSVRGAVLRVAKTGETLYASGITKVVGKLKWFQLQPPDSGWALEDGAELGLGRLLERVRPASRERRGQQEGRPDGGHDLPEVAVESSRCGALGPNAGERVEQESVEPVGTSEVSASESQGPKEPPSRAEQASCRGCSSESEAPERAEFRSQDRQETLEQSTITSADAIVQSEASHRGCARTSDDIVTLKATGDRALKQGNFFSAVSLYSEILNIPANSGEPVQLAAVASNRSAAYAKIGDFEHALEDALLAERFRPEWSRAKSRKALALLRLRRLSEALDAYAESITADPGDRASLSGLREALVESGVGFVGRKAGDSGASEAKAAGNIAIGNGSFAMAVLRYTEAIGLSEAGLRSDFSKPPSAQKNDEHVVFSSVLYSNRSAAFMQLHLYERALEDATWASQLRGEWPKSHTRRAAALQALGRCDEAFLAFGQALRLQPGNAEAWRGQALCLRDLPAWQSPRAQRLRSRFFIDAQLPKGSTRIFTVSDVHIGQPGAMDWAKAISRHTFQNDVLLVAGNVADTIRQLRFGLSVLRSKFRRVFFTPGNHELWVHPSEARTFPCSISKFLAILELCEELSMDVLPAAVSDGLFVVPLFSWYTAEFDEHDPHPGKYVFDTLCKWTHMDEEKVWKFFLQLNQQFLDLPLYGEVVTFSHFLPRRSLPYSRAIPGELKAIGCAALDEQLRAARSRAHVYGHTSVRHVATEEGVTYIQNALGGPEDHGPAHPLICVHDGSGCLQQKWTSLERSVPLHRGDRRQTDAHSEAAAI
eukprot:CAMPEP_0203894456 /NCGR_PEP_ID=MMETSP0359-20131031/37415_1 /ASSEMBLY_ACC=CAM_ASM_000338 /TAXON_ID=268821 /ORGANISM="Scrippsiella Hangoei, Strain SHTV-5" /LENGTH=1742 /DNA_ID=CAMNT_0050816759 /DNA_START=62 /DNA_END=5288 /DNA_ORIENTATION=-